MCGINGFVTKKELKDGWHRIKKMNDSLVHRGPDAEGIAEINKGYIGQRRLAIIDIDSRSNQPMQDGNSIIVYNGEIYNYKKIRRKLSSDFKTNSDTEVLLLGIKENGIEWLEECNGMFAFAYYDGKKLILGRDRLGIKPLYYYADGEMFVFSSEIKGILNSGLVCAEFNEDAIDEYLGNRYIREPYTFFKNIYQVPAGHIICVDNDLKFEIKKYWSMPNEFNMLSEYDEEAIYEQFKIEIEKAIKKRMISDVALGTYLSGGIDSSIISAICANDKKGLLNTYTIGFENLNEFVYARMVAEKYHTIHHEIIIDEKDYLGKIKEIISYKDAPLGVPNEIPLALMSKILKKDITVVLSGEGADELMGGYGKIFRAPFDFEHSDANCGLDFYDYFIKKYEYVPRQIRDKYLLTNHKIRDEKDNIIRKKFLGKSNEENVFRFFHEYHIKGLLQRVDTTTMYASVEARVPFLDHELIEFVYQKVPYELKIKWNDDKQRKMAEKIRSIEYSEVYDQPKYLLRKMGIELLPKEVVFRKKMGFPVPLNEWFDELKKMAYPLLKHAKWLDNDKLLELINDCQNYNCYGQMLWMFINIELFRKMYFEKEWRY